jgi:N-acetylmuramoyl-L-alanine amidase
LPQSKDAIEKRGERAMMRAIQNFHMDDRGWADFAYSFAVFPSGRVYRGRGWKRQGAHTEGRNDVSIAVCFMGNFEVEKPTDKALKAARKLRQKGIQERRLTPNVRTAGHRAAPGASTACPGQFLVNRIKEIG